MITIWRGRMLAFTWVIRSTLYELGFYGIILYLAAIYASGPYTYAPLATGGFLA
jgi:hypothetical protein